MFYLVAFFSATSRLPVALKIGNLKTNFDTTEMPEQIWHKEAEGAPESRICGPLEGPVLTPRVFSTSNPVFGHVLHRSGKHSLSIANKKTIANIQTRVYDIL